MKWIITAACASLLTWFIWFQLSSTKISYVNGLAPYDEMPGREYILQHDSYVFVWEKNPASGFPLLGVNELGVASSVAALPRDGAAASIGHELPEVRIIDVIAKGTRFRITSVRREQSRRAGTIISYEAKFLDEVDRPYQKVDIRPLLLSTGTAGEVPQVDEGAAVPWIKR